MKETTKKLKENITILQQFQKIVFELTENNIDDSAKFLMDLFDSQYIHSCNYIVYNLIYSSFISQSKDYNIYFSLLKTIDKLENNKNNVLHYFSVYIFEENSKEALYLFEKLVEQKLIRLKSFFTKKIAANKKKYFLLVHHLSDEQFDNNFYLLFGSEYYNRLKQIKENNWELHKQLIEEGVNPNEIPKIIRNDEIEKLQEITSQTNFVFNQKIKQSIYERCSFINQENVTLIDYAAFYGSVKCFKYLLMNGANIENTGEYAVAGGNLEIIHLCEQNHSAFINGYETAIKYHRNDIFHYLYENTIDKNFDVKELIKSCIKNNNFEILNFLLDENVCIDKNIIQEIIKSSNIFLIKNFDPKELIKYSSLPNACSTGNITYAKYLLKNMKIDINAQGCEGKTVLFDAIESGKTEMVKLLLKQKGIVLNNKIKLNGQNELLYASFYGKSKIVKQLLKFKKFDINYADIRGETSLMIASKYGEVSTVKTLLKHKGIDVTSKNIIGESALILASINGYIEIVKLLLEQEGIDINEEKDWKENSLFWASKNGHVEVAKFLIKNGIDINHKSNNGVTALMNASYNGYIEIVQILLNEKEIKINDTDNYGWTALMLASFKGDVEIV